MRLVDADMLIKTIPTEEINARMAIATAPTIEAEPIRHGRWEIVYYDNVPTLAYCNRCDQVLQLTRKNETMPNYCPHCGAVMDEVEE